MSNPHGRLLPPHPAKFLAAFCRKSARWLGLLVLGLFGLIPAVRAQTAVLRTLYTFTGAPDGQNPSGAMVRGMDGNLYGVTSAGGAHGYGAIFMLTPAGAVTILHSFFASDGSTPRGTLLQDSAGDFFGTTIEGGDNANGTVFELTSNGIFFSLYSFSAADANGVNADGQYPRGELAMDASGNLYGACANGGGANDGTVFELTTGGTLDTLYSFFGPDGANPAAGVILGKSGLLYGTTGSNRSGDNGTGTVYSVDAPHQNLTSIYNFNAEDTNGFNTDGALPQGAVIQGTDGNLYGTTLAGGTNGSGTLFKVTPTGSAFTTLHNFSAVTSGKNIDGYDCLGALVQGSDGNFYGEAQFGGANGNGTLYQITPGGTFTTLYSFGAVSNGVNADGTTPGSALIEGNNGTFYGVASFGGASGVGTIFELTVSPAVTSAATATASPGTAFSYQIKATNTPTSYSVSGLTGGLKFNANTGLISGTPTAKGTIKLIISASNSAGTGSRNLTITVSATAPTISSFSSASGKTGTIVVIKGANFVAPLSVIFAGNVAAVHSFNATQINAQVPAGAVTGPIKVNTNNGSVSTASSFTDTTPPTISSFSPASGKVGATVVIKGTGFQAPLSVIFAGNKAAVHSFTATEINAAVPSGALTGAIKVNTSYGSVSTSSNFTVSP